ncbi:MAG: TetR/AcrR family transcriptional regulator [Solirubrobacteraceae bacterium]
MATVKSAPRRRMTAAARRDQVLDVTRSIVAERGFQGVSIQTVAASAGITRPIVYEHFGSLDGLLDELVRREMSKALEQIEATALGDLGAADPVELMLESLSSYLAAVAANPDTWRLVLMPPAGAPPSLASRVERGRARVLRGLAAAVRPGALSGLSRDPEVTARILSAMADEYARLILEAPALHTAERLLTHARLWLSNVA